MIEFNIKVQIPKFNKYSLEIDCPKCKLSNWITIGHIKRKDIIVCRGCHSNILLEDFENKANRTFNKLKKQLKSMEKKL